MAKVRKHKGNFDARLNQRLLASVEAAANSWDSPYEFALSSGFREGDPRFHGKGQALDFELYDPKTGAKLDNYKEGAQFEPYQQFANHWYQSLTPEEQAQARWGGYFGDPNSPDFFSKYGNQDPMHLDFGRSASAGMNAGDWNTGFSQDAMNKLGLKNAGGIEAQAAAMKQAGYSDDQIRAAFLSTIAGTEAPGYDTLYGGGSFGSDYSKHPNRQMPIMSGPNKGDYSTAAGRYQFLNSTWADQQKKLGLKDFSPESQDAAAWDLAATNYATATGGGDLMEALKSGDPARQNAAAQILSKTWTSLPGGIEQAKGYGTSTFADKYKGYLGGAAGQSVHPPNPTVGTGGYVKPGASTKQVSDPTQGVAAAKPKEFDWSKFGSSAAEGLGDMGAAAGGTPTTVPDQPRAALAPTAGVSFDDGQRSELERQKLAMYMARLNSGKLWV